MSSFYILSKDKSQVDVSTKAETSYVNDEVSKLKTLISTEDAKLLDLQATRTLLDDLTLNDKAIIGVDDINASNSVPSKGFVRGELAKKLDLAGGTLTGALTLNTTTCPTPTQDTHVANKKYIDDLIASLQLDRSTYALGFIAFPQNTWRIGAFPTNSSPTGLMDCSGLDENSYFVLKTHTFDADDAIPSNAPFEYKLYVIDAAGYSRTWSFLKTNISNYKYSTRYCVFNLKYYWKDFVTGGNYKTFKVCDLQVRRTFSGTFGCESHVTFQIVK